ncbi:MAG: hypothetical protein DI551_05210 [Micavibrio aeruginosavorus]|uniref:HTH tetR-type domain-containing protein n=1 Tax=Micavibrio aeruginosavorus TaxID=349221 RepID=A0A2W5N1X1_9BACT|nr:MAG: hypothetical protein DI551_05210 [Micavibrio aeruginosavorus]
MAKKHGPNKENLEATRRIFLDIARKEFSTLGYYNASTAKIVAESGMARGSLYYHFGDKKGLFRAVYEQLMQEMQAEIHNRIASQTDVWTGFMVGCLGVLDLLTTSETRRIIIDVHTALTYGERIEILQKTLLAELSDQLEKVLAANYFKGYDARPLSILIFGFLSEGGRSFEISNDVAKTREEIGQTFTNFMEKARG